VYFYDLAGNQESILRYKECNECVVPSVIHAQECRLIERATKQRGAIEAIDAISKHVTTRVTECQQFLPATSQTGRVITCINQ
jgi:hypothetical protein